MSTLPAVKKRHYKSPPIEEAVCEFQFAGEQREWEEVQRFIESLSDLYPGQLQKKRIVRTDITVDEGGGPVYSVAEEIARLQKGNEGKTRLVSVGRRALSLSTLRPYDSWKNFQERTLRVLSRYEQTFGKAEVNQVSTRYINVVRIPLEMVELEQFFNFPQIGVPALDARIVSFASGTKYDLGNNRFVTIGINDKPGNGSVATFVMDLDVLWRMSGPPETIGMEEALEELNALHDVEWQIFEAMITDKTRLLFGGEDL